MRHLYLHVPFCVRRCSYCDFSIAVRKRIPVREYVDAVLGELQLLRAADPGPTARGSFEAGLDTIYLRGGTPAPLPPATIHQLLCAISVKLPISPFPLPTVPETLPAKSED